MGRKRRRKSHASLLCVRTLEQGLACLWPLLGPQRKPLALRRDFTKHSVTLRTDVTLRSEATPSPTHVW